MDEQRQDDQLEPTNSSSMRIQDVALEIYRKRWTIEAGGGRGPGRAMLMVRHDDDDDDDDFIIDSLFRQNVLVEVLFISFYYWS